MLIHILLLFLLIIVIDQIVILISSECIYSKCYRVYKKYHSPSSHKCKYEYKKNIKIEEPVLLAPPITVTQPIDSSNTAPVETTETTETPKDKTNNNLEDSNSVDVINTNKDNLEDGFDRLVKENFDIDEKKFNLDTQINYYNSDTVEDYFINKNKDISSHDLAFVDRTKRDYNAIDIKNQVVKKNSEVVMKTRFKYF